MSNDLDNFDELGADNIGGGDDGTDSPYMGQDMYNGGREDVILGHDLDALGMSALGRTPAQTKARKRAIRHALRGDLDALGAADPLLAAALLKAKQARKLGALRGDFVGGAAPFEYEPELKFGLDDFEDLTALGISEPMTWGSDYPCAMGWDEMGADVFGWSPFAAVSNAVKKVATTVKPPVVKAAVAVAKPAAPKPPTGIAAVIAKAKAAQAAKPPAKPPAPAPKPSSAATAALLKSPIVKPVAGGAALVFPPKGIPMAAGLAAAAGIAAAVKSPIPAQAAAAKQVVINTHQVASTPGPDQKAAQVSLAAMALAANAKKGEAAANAPKPAPVFVPVAVAPKAPPSPNLPAVPVGGRRIANVFGSRRLTHDISPQGYIATYVT